MTADRYLDLTYLGEVCERMAQPPPLAASLGSGAFVLRRAWPPLRRRPERLAPASHLPLKCHSGMRAGAARPSVTALGHSSASGAENGSLKDQMHMART